MRYTEFEIGIDKVGNEIPMFTKTFDFCRWNL